MRRTLTRTAAVASALALLTACGNDTTSTSTTSQSDAGSASAPADGGSASSDAAGASEGPAAAAPPSDTFTLGSILPETGQLAFLGPPMEQGLAMAVDDVNAAGGVLGTKIPAVVAGDEAGQEPVAQASADRVLSQGVSAIIGAASSGMSLAIVDKVSGAKVVQCSGSNTAPTFTDLEDDGYYVRTAPSDALQGPVLANTIVDDGWSNVAIIARADDYGKGLLDATSEALENAGATVAVKETYDPAATDYSSAIQSVIAAKPDAVVIVSFEEGVQIIQGLIEGGITPGDYGMYGTDGLRNADLAKLVSKDDPTALAGFKGTAPASADNPEFVEKLKAFAPDLKDTQFAPQIYDCVVTLALAAEVAKSPVPEDYKAEINGVTKDGEKCTSFEECRDLVAKGEDIDYDGASGPLDFTDAGEPGRASIEVYEFDEKGELTSVETVESNPEAGR